MREAGWYIDSNDEGRVWYISPDDVHVVVETDAWGRVCHVDEMFVPKSADRIDIRGNEGIDGWITPEEARAVFRYLGEMYAKQKEGKG